MTGIYDPYWTLLRAVLDDAFIFLRMYNRARERGTRIKPGLLVQLAQDREWVLDDDISNPFAFVSICLTLNLNPSELRRVQ